MAKSWTVKVDANGRMVIPAAIRKAWGIAVGDVVLGECDGATLILRRDPAENPFDTLLERALLEDSTGRTQDLQSFVAEHGGSSKAPS